MPIKSLLLAVLLLFPLSAFAQWALDANDSSIHFISVKKSTLAETHHFSKLSGGIDRTGKVTLNIDLTSVETNIPIRNERMQKMLFDTANFAAADIVTQVDTKMLDALKPGQTTQVEADLQVGLHGVQHNEKARLQVTGLDNNRVLVSSIAPVVLNAGNYQLLAGIEALREVAGLNSISPLVPISATLVFTKQ